MASSMTPTPPRGLAQDVEILGGEVPRLIRAMKKLVRFAPRVPRERVAARLQMRVDDLAHSGLRISLRVVRTDDSSMDFSRSPRQSGLRANGSPLIKH